MSILYTQVMASKSSPHSIGRLLLELSSGSGKDEYAGFYLLAVAFWWLYCCCRLWFCYCLFCVFFLKKILSDFQLLWLQTSKIPQNMCSMFKIQVKLKPSWKMTKELYNSIHTPYGQFFTHELQLKLIFNHKYTSTFPKISLKNILFSV